METPQSKEIHNIISDMMDRVIKKVTETDPFLPEEHKFKKPLYAALVPDEIFKGSHFERRFVTPFGKIWEQLAKAVGSFYFDIAELGRKITGTIKQSRLRRIQEVLDNLEHANNTVPNWEDELAYILDANAGDEDNVTVIADLYIENSDTYRASFELKAPLPNSDQTKVSKEKMLKLYGMTETKIDEAYYALPYNPYGQKEDYEWWPPFRWFNMKEDEVVLIGDEFWDKLGGKGTFLRLIEVVEEIGPKYKKIIYEEYLGIVDPNTNNL